MIALRICSIIPRTQRTFTSSLLQRKTNFFQRIRTMSDLPARPPADQPTIFDKILDGSIPANFIHQDDKCVAFKDVSPQVLKVDSTIQYCLFCICWFSLQVSLVNMHRLLFTSW